MKNHTGNSPTVNLPAEWVLLPLCCKYKPSEAERTRIADLIHRPLDWDAFLRQIRKNHVGPIVYQNLKTTDCCKVNAPFWAALEAIYRRNQIQAMRRYAETLRLIERFEAQQIPTLSLKGSVLSQVLYGDISMRISGDIDLLISPASLEKAEEILLQEGYVQQETQGEMTERQRALLLKTQHHFGYWNAEKKLFVELHWRLLAATYCFHFDELWAQRTRLNLHGRQLHVLSTEENLLTLASHGAKHAWYRLKWLCDIQAILQMEGLCQRYIVRQAWQRGIEPMLAQAFILCHQLFHTELHADWFAPEAFLRAQRLAQLALVFILSPDVWINSPDRIWRFRNKAYMLLLNRGSTRKLSFFISSLYPIGEDFRQIRIGDRYFALYYVLRPIFIIKRFLHIDRKRDAKQ